MKKNNLWRIIWIIGIYAILVSILYLVIIYKVKWENKDLNTYLYFYSCSNELCTATYEVDDYYSRVVCKDKICPFIKEKNNNLVILDDGNNPWLYDYINGNIVSNEYFEYKGLDNGNYIAKNIDNLYGIIDSNNNVLIDFKYDMIIDYNNNFVVYGEKNKVGVENKETSISVEAIYDDIVLINDKLFSYCENNKYFIASYDTKEPVSEVDYDYVYSTDNSILVFNDNKLDILDISLKSKLLMKIDTHYSYTAEKERGSLEIYKRDNLLYFSILNSDNNKIQYIYDLKNNKLIN